MNYPDIIFAIILLWAIYRGAKKGAVRQVAQLAALALGIWGALRYAGIASEYILTHYEPGMSERTIFFFCFGGLFILILLLVHLLGTLTARFVKAIALGIVNRIFGAIFCVGKYLLLLAVLTALADKTDQVFHFIPQEQKESSLLYEPLLNFFGKLLEFARLR